MTMAGRVIKEQVMYVDAPPPRRDVLVVDEERFRSPPPRYHSPASERITKVEPDRHYYSDGRTTNRYHGQRGGYDEYYSHGYGTSRSLSCRRCCVAITTLLILLGLAGLAVGLYFGITGAQAQATANLPENNVQNGYSGYYVDGVYVVPVTTKPSETYLIYGVDMPCNPNNNNGATDSPYYPDCNEVTTSIVISNWTTTTTVAPAVLNPSAFSPPLLSSKPVFAVLALMAMRLTYFC